MATQKTYSAQEAEERYDKLPQEVKDLLYSPEMRILIKKIAEKNQLHIDQMGLLEVEVGTVMLGFTEPQDFSKLLEENLRLDSQKAQALAKDVNDMIFSKIREAMKKVYEVHATPAPIKEASNPMSPPMAPPAPTAPPMNASSTPISLQTTPGAVPPAPPRPIPPLATPTPAASVPPKPTTVPSPVPKKEETPKISPADVMLSEKTVEKAAPSTPPGPQPYKKDPYHEPIEP